MSPRKISLKTERDKERFGVAYNKYVSQSEMQYRDVFSAKF